MLIFESTRMFPIILYGKKTLNIARETQLQAVQEMFNDYLVKGKICTQRKRTEFLLEQKLRFEKELMKAGDEFNEKIINAYEKADKIQVPELKKKQVELISNSIKTYNTLSHQLQDEFQNILNEAVQIKDFLSTP
ncbi:MAG: DUF342 domain-containing protein [Desulfobacterales bacterium]|nr:DUF342 domain-containing protein [Desulfobacterales bacterium]